MAELDFAVIEDAGDTTAISGATRSGAAPLRPMTDPPVADARETPPQAAGTTGHAAPAPGNDMQPAMTGPAPAATAAPAMLPPLVGPDAAAQVFSEPPAGQGARPGTTPPAAPARQPRAAPPPFSAGPPQADAEAPVRNAAPARHPAPEPAPGTAASPAAAAPAAVLTLAAPEAGPATPVATLAAVAAPPPPATPRAPLAQKARARADLAAFYAGLLGVELSHGDLLERMALAGGDQVTPGVIANALSDSGLNARVLSAPRLTPGLWPALAEMTSGQVVLVLEQRGRVVFVHDTSCPGDRAEVPLTEFQSVYSGTVIRAEAGLGELVRRHAEPGRRPHWFWGEFARFAATSARWRWGRWWPTCWRWRWRFFRCRSTTG